MGTRAAHLADRIQLQQVLLNFIINAIEAIDGVDEGPRDLLVCSNKHAIAPPYW